MGDGSEAGGGCEGAQFASVWGALGALALAAHGQVRSQLQPLSRAHDAASGREGAWAAESFRACASP